MSKRVGVDTQVWEQFCEALKVEGSLVLGSEQQLDEVTQAEGLRYLSRLVRMGFERYIEFSSAINPTFFKLCHETEKLGGDNPDNLYLSCRIRSDFCYRITGNRGTVGYISLSLADDRLDTSGAQLTTGFMDSQSLQVDTQGNFEIRLGGEEEPGNWLPLRGGTNTVFVRQTFRDRKAEKEATFNITRVSETGEPERLSTQLVEEGLKKSLKFFKNAGRQFVDWSESYYPHRNTLPPADQDYIASVGGDPNTFYYLSAFSLKPNEALLIHLPEVPQCEAWNFQLCNHWLESLDYVNHNIHVNQSSAVPNVDDSVTIIVANKDPGLPNWLDTCDHSIGTMVFRWTGAERIVHPLSSLVLLSEILPSHLKRWDTVN